MPCSTRCQAALCTVALLAVQVLVFCTAAENRDTQPSPTPYQRQYFTPKGSFFNEYWYLGFAIMLLVVLTLFLILLRVMEIHFREREQRIRRNEIRQHNDKMDSSDESESTHETQGGTIESASPSIRSRNPLY